MWLRQNWMTTVVAVWLGMTLSGCAGSVDERDLPGTYRAAYDFGTEELTLRADSTYEQTFAEASRPPISINRGRWTMAQGDAWDRAVLVLHDAVGVVDGFGKRSDSARHAAQPFGVRSSVRGRWSQAGWFVRSRFAHSGGTHRIRVYRRTRHRHRHRGSLRFVIIVASGRELPR